MNPLFNPANATGCAADRLAGRPEFRIAAAVHLFHVSQSIAPGSQLPKLMCPFIIRRLAGSSREDGQGIQDYKIIQSTKKPTKESATSRIRGASPSTRSRSPCPLTQNLLEPQLHNDAFQQRKAKPDACDEPLALEVIEHGRTLKRAHQHGIRLMTRVCLMLHYFK